MIQPGRQNRTLDLMCPSRIELEAWVQALLFLCPVQPTWGPLVLVCTLVVSRASHPCRTGERLEIVNMPQYQALDPIERIFCEENHVNPSQYLICKRKGVQLTRRGVPFLVCHSTYIFVLIHFFHCFSLGKGYCIHARH